MSGIILERAEFLALMDAVKADTIVGLDTDALVPPSQAEHIALIEQGLDSLRQRGAVELVDGVNAINTDLLSMALLIASPEVAVVTTRDNPGLGQQLFLHYTAGEVVVEQTLPSATQHRWALVPGLAGLVERLLGILPVQEAPSADSFRVEIPQETFLEVKGQIEGDQAEAAKGALRHLQWPEAAIRTFVETLRQPVFGGTIAVLRCEHREVVDARNLALVQGPHAALWMRQVVPGEPVLEVATVAAGQVRELLTTWLAEIQPVAS